MRTGLIYLRKGMRWLTTVGLLMALGVWIGSFFFWATGSIPSRSVEVEVRAGQIEVTRVLFQGSPFVFQLVPWQVWRAPTVDYSNAPGFDFEVREPIFRCKLWMPVTVLAVAAALCWRLDGRAARRHRNGCCVQCGYDRRGLGPDVPCPECGKPPRSPSRWSGLHAH